MQSDTRCACGHASHYHDWDGSRYTYCRFPGKCPCEEFIAHVAETPKEQSKLL